MNTVCKSFVNVSVVLLDVYLQVDHMCIESKFIFERPLFNFESFCVCMTMDTNPCRMTHYLALISSDSFLAPPSHLLIDYLKTWWKGQSCF